MYGIDVLIAVEQMQFHLPQTIIGKIQERCLEEVGHNLESTLRPNHTLIHLTLHRTTILGYITQQLKISQRLVLRSLITNMEA